MSRSIVSLLFLASVMSWAGSFAEAGTVPPGFGPEIQIGGFGTMPTLIFTHNGNAHLSYRREKKILYRFFDGATQSFGPEIEINNQNSRAESEFLDRNQPKMTVEPESGSAWIVWGGSVRDVDRNLYLRGVTPTGQIATAVKAYAHPENILNPEDVAVGFDPQRKRLHLYSIHVGDPTKILDGHYDFSLNGNLGVTSIEQIGPPQKNLAGYNSDNRAYTFARLNQYRFYQTTPLGSGQELYHEFFLHPELPLGELGAFRFETRDDRIVHFAAVSTVPPEYKQRDIIYYRFSTINENDFEEVRVENFFESVYGLAQPALTPDGNILIVYDKKRPNDGKSAPAYSYRLAGADEGSSFSLPRFIPDYPVSSDAHAPFAAAFGERVFVVWGDRVRQGLYLRTFDFEQPVSTPTPTSTNTPLPTFTPTNTATATSTFTPTATPTPDLLATGGTEVFQVQVEESDRSVELSFHIVSPPVSQNCEVELEVQPPSGSSLTYPMTNAVQSYSYPDPVEGTWILTARNGQSCPEFAFYLTASAIPMVPAGALPLLVLALGFSAVLPLARRRRRS